MTTGSLDGRVSIVTGAGQGVGRGVALALSEAGSAVVMMGRTKGKVEAVADEIKGRGRRAVAVEGDVKRPADLERCVASAIDAYGRLDVLVNNAQEMPRGNLLEMDEALLQAAWESGPLATLRMMRLCHPHLKGGGSIINMGSRSGVRPDPAGLGGYAAIKEAIRSLSRAAAVEWGSDRIRVNIILPFATTPALERFAQAQPDAYRATLAATPLGRAGDPESDIGRVAVFLASDDSSYITGVTVPVDGGLSFVG
jgi:meso-butanediol dehydrogenase / (S,S)-butanediol dehydrogenase / diacetyl reductase